MIAPPHGLSNLYLLILFLDIYYFINLYYENFLYLFLFINSYLLLIFLDISYIAYPHLANDS